MNKENPKIIFFGTPDFGVIVLKKLIENDLKPVLIITSPDKPKGRKQIITPPPVRDLAQENNLPTVQTEENQIIKSEITELNPDLIIVAAFGKILPKEILDIPKHGSLNIHPSLLPKYRGPSPIQAAILNGDQETGVTIFLMNEEMDQGSIISKTNLEIDPQVTYKELEEQLAQLGAKLLIEILPQWLNKEIEPQPQEESQTTYTKIIKKDSGRIDWQKPALEIERQIRAYNPWPSSFCKLNDKILKIWKASTLEQQEKRNPGEVFLIDNKVAVQTDQDYLIIEELQLEGKNRMKTEDFLRGNKNFIGKTLK